MQKLVAFSCNRRFVRHCAFLLNLFLMAKVYGMSYKEIAAELNIGTSVIEKHVAKGLEICHAYMQRMEDPEQQNQEQQKTAAKQYEQSSTVNNIEELIARQLGGQDKR